MTIAQASLHLAMAIAGAPLPADPMDAFPGIRNHIEKAKGGGWRKQLRVPAGLPTGGRWTTYGSGGIGTAYAEGGVPLKLQTWESDLAPAAALNAKIAVIEKAANEGYLHPDAVPYLSKPKVIGQNTSVFGLIDSAHEASAYVNTIKAKGLPVKSGATADSAPVSKPKPIGTADNMMTMDGLTHFGPKPGGAADGAVYKDANGDKWLVKTYPSNATAINEVAANKLFGILGHKTPEARLIQTNEGSIGVASKWIDDLQQFKPGDPIHVAAAKEVFGTHALMANHDVFGNHFDNLPLDKNGVPVAIDAGGALAMKGIGSPKGAAFGTTVGEIDSMRNKGLNPKAAQIFGQMTNSEIIESSKKAYSAFEQSEGQIKDTLIAYMGQTAGAKMFDKMKARAEDLKSRTTKMEAEAATVTTAKISETGTKIGVVGAPLPDGVQVHIDAVKGMAEFQAMAFLNSKEKKIDAQISSGNYKTVSSSHPSMKGFMGALWTMSLRADEGDPEAIKQIYDNFVNGIPKSYMLLPGFSGFAYAAKGYQNKAEVVAAKNFIKNPTKTADVPESALHGNTVTPEALKSAKNAAGLGDVDDVNGKQVSVVKTAEAPDTEPLNPPPAAPLKPNFTFSPVFKAKADAMEEAFNSGSSDSVMAILSTVKGNGAYSVTLREYGYNLMQSLKGTPKSSAPVKSQSPTSKMDVSGVKFPDPPNFAFSPDFKIKADNLGKLAASGEFAQLKSQAASIKGKGAYSVSLKQYADSLLGAMEGASSASAKSVHSDFNAGLVAAAAAIKVADAQNTSGKGTYTVETEVNGFKVVNTYSTPEFNPNTIPKMDTNVFNNLYSDNNVAVVNTATAKAMYEAALNNDLAGLNQLDPQSSKSKHLVSYKNKLIEALENSTKPKLVSTEYPDVVTAKDLISTISKSYSPIKVNDESAKHVAKYIVASEPNVGYIPPTGPEFPVYKSDVVTDLAQSLHADSAESVKNMKATAGVKYWTSNNSFGAADKLRTNSVNADTTEGKKILATAVAVNRAAIPLPEGTVIQRTMSMSGWSKEQKDAFLGSAGKVLKEKAPVSWRYDLNSPWNGGADIIFRGVSAKGSKGIFAGYTSGYQTGSALSSHPGEREMLMPGGTRMYVNRVRTREQAIADGDLDINVANTKYVVDVIMMEYDPSHFQL